MSKAPCAFIDFLLFFYYILFDLFNVKIISILKILSSITNHINLFFNLINLILKLLKKKVNFQLKNILKLFFFLSLKIKQNIRKIELKKKRAANFTETKGGSKLTQALYMSINILNNMKN